MGAGRSLVCFDYPQSSSVTFPISCFVSIDIFWNIARFLFSLFSDLMILWNGDLSLAQLKAQTISFIIVLDNFSSNFLLSEKVALVRLGPFMIPNLQYPLYLKLRNLVLFTRHALDIPGL